VVTLIYRSPFLQRNDRGFVGSETIAVFMTMRRTRKPLQEINPHSLVQSLLSDWPVNIYDKINFSYSVYACSFVIIFEPIYEACFKVSNQEALT
jgi:hypothetical protein